MSCFSPVFVGCCAFIGQRAERNARGHEGEPETVGGYDADVGLSAAVREELQDFHSRKLRAVATRARHAEARFI